MNTIEKRRIIERGLVRNFLRVGKENGWTAVSVFNAVNDISVECENNEQIVAAVFAEHRVTRITFNHQFAGVQLINVERGLSIDCIRDADVPEHFQAVMDSVADYVEALHLAGD